MKLLIEIPLNRKLLVSANANSGVLLQALTEVQLINESGWGDTKKIEIDTENRLEFSVVNDDFTATPSDFIVKLQKEKQDSDARWIEYYNKANEFEKQLKALQADLDARSITYSKVGVK